MKDEKIEKGSWIPSGTSEEEIKKTPAETSEKASKKKDSSKEVDPSLLTPETDQKEGSKEGSKEENQVSDSPKVGGHQMDKALKDLENFNHGDGIKTPEHSLSEDNPLVEEAEFVDIDVRKSTPRKRALDKLKGVNLIIPIASIVFLMMLGTVFSFIWNGKIDAEQILHEAPGKAYILEAEGRHDEAKRVWIQANSRSKWYKIGAGFGTNIDQPYLQKASLAFKAEDWQAVTEYGFKALTVPITDIQAVDVQQMLLTATANLVRAYLPNQSDQPIKGGVPEHALPICEGGGNGQWIVPLFLVAMAAMCLFGRMYKSFLVVAFMVPLYFFIYSNHLDATEAECEARLLFNPKQIELFPDSLPDMKKILQVQERAHGVETPNPITIKTDNHIAGE